MSWLAEFGGRYAAFVGPAYGFAAIVLTAMTLDTLWRARRWRAAADRKTTRGAEERRPPG